jgi:UDP-N-acetylmuramate dehydrogenase
MILNGGSNVLFTSDFDGLVIKIASSGFDKLEENSDQVMIRVAAGQNWDDFVMACLKNGYYGLENLTMIPGNTGAAPMQNIGAYGVEQKDYFFSLEALNRKTGETEVFDRQQCKFGYRESVFKNTHKDRYIILNVTYKLSKKTAVKTSYGAIKLELEKLGKSQNPSPVDVSQAVRNIRTNKLPDPEELGNAGSFFKNPVLSPKKYRELKNTFPDVVAFPLENGNYKLAAGWMIDRLGWKGRRIGDAGVCETQALVLVNHGKAAGSDILKLTSNIQKSVRDEYGIRLEPEVNIL